MYLTINQFRFSKSSNEKLKDFNNFIEMYRKNLFCFALDEECEEVNKMKENGAGGVLCFNEALPIMQFIVSKIDETQK